MIGQSAQALDLSGASDIDTDIALVGASCTFNVYLFGAFQDAEIRFNPAPGRPWAGDSYWVNGIDVPGTPMLASDLEAHCNLTGVSALSHDGANGSYGSDGFVGITFQATSLADGLTYDYTFGLSGAGPTTVANTRTLVAANTPPTAAAGTDQTVASGASVVLDGTASDANDAGQSLTYWWAQSGGTSVSLSSQAVASPSFTAPTLVAGAPDEVLTFSLVVNDGVEDSVADTVQITVQAPANTPPTANAGVDRTVAPAANVNLSGVLSDANDVGQSLTYAWTQTGGTSVSLTGANTITPSFTAPTLVIGDADAVLTFQLIVNDGVVDSAPDTMQVTVTAPLNTPPTANAGSDTTVPAEFFMVLSGAGSTSGDAGQPLTYAWTQTSGPMVTLSSATDATPSFTAPSMAPGDPTLSLVFQLIVNDGFVDSAADTVTIQVTAPANTPPTANAGPPQIVAAGAAVSLDGSASDPNDAGQVLTYAWTQSVGPAVVLSGATTATPSFTATTPAPLGPDDILGFQLIVNDGITDSSPALVEVQVQAPGNTPPTAHAGTDQTVSAGAGVTLSGHMSDPGDPGQVVTYSWSQTGGTTVTLSDTTSVAPSFTAPIPLAGSADQVLTFQLVVHDGLDPSLPDTVEITVQAPPNTPPTADAGPDQTVAAGAAVTLSGALSTPNDPGQGLSYNWSQIGGTPVTLSNLSAISPSFTAPVPAIGAPDTVLVFQLFVEDGFDPSVPDTVQITVQAPLNTPATADAGPDQTVPSGAPVVLSGAGSDANDPGQGLVYHWAQTGGISVTLTGDTTATPSFTAPVLPIGAPDMPLTFQLIVDDGFGPSAPDTVQITTQAPPNIPPSADAGPDQNVASGASVTLDGNGSTAVEAGQTLSYAWAQTGGPAVVLSGDTTVMPSFTAPTVPIGALDVVLTFQLIVSDGFDPDGPDFVQITVAATPNTPPTAVAGSDRSVFSGATVTLDGSSSDAGDPGQMLSFAWRQTGGTTVSLNNDTLMAPQFVTPPLPIGAPDEVLSFELVVNDGLDDSVADTVQITVMAPPNTPPTAVVAPPPPVIAGNPATLDGSISTPNDPGQTLTYAWSQTGGAPVTLSGATTATPGFTAPMLPIGAPPMLLNFQLVVNDGFHDSPPASVSVSVLSPPNTPPTADAGPDQTVASAAMVTLDGALSSSNDPGQPLTLDWAQTGGVAVTLSSASATSPTFTAPTLAIGDADVVLTFELTASDGVGPGDTDTVQITVEAPANTVPTADAGSDQTVATGVVVTLDGSGSDANDPGQALIHSWVQTGGPAVALSSTADVSPTFTAPALSIGDANLVLSFALTVNDGFDDSPVDTVQVTVQAPVNTTPTADAGADQLVASGSAVTLDGSGSDANDAGQGLTFSWTQTGGPAVALSGASTAAPGFTAPILPINGADVVLTFELVVHDGFDPSPADSVTVTVEAPADTTAPVVTLSGAPAMHDGVAAVAVAIGFSEPVVGFDASDLDLSGGTLDSLSGGGQAFTATILPSARLADIRLSVPARAVADAAGNENAASNVVLVRADTASATAEAVEDGLEARRRAFLRSQPNLRRLRFGGGTGEMSLRADGDGGNLLLRSSKGQRLWFEATAEWSREDGNEQSYAHFALGYDLMRFENFILGAMLQVDRSDTTLADGTFKGEGWMVGPYIVGRVPGQPLLYSASLLYGKTDNDLSLTGLATAGFETERLLFTAGIEGHLDLPKARTLILSFDTAYLREKQEAFIDGGGAAVAAQVFETFDASLGAELVVPIDGATLSAGLFGVYSHESGPGGSSDELRAKVTLGAEIITGDRSRLDIEAFYDGIGASGSEAYGLSGLFVIEF